MKKEPTLVTLMGDEFPDLSFMDESDLNMLMGACGLSDDSYLLGAEDVETYLDKKYPEYMGIWGTIIKGVLKVGKKVGGGLFRRVRDRIRSRRGKGKKKSGSDKKMKALQAQLVFAQKQKMLRDQKAKKDQQNKMMIGIAAAAAAAVALL